MYVSEQLVGPLKLHCRSHAGREQETRTVSRGPCQLAWATLPAETEILKIRFFFPITFTCSFEPKARLGYQVPYCTMLRLP